jgi:hypothetical protein
VSDSKVRLGKAGPAFRVPQQLVRQLLAEYRTLEGLKRVALRFLPGLSSQQRQDSLVRLAARFAVATR